jgi:hypothetical protein
MAPEERRAGSAYEMFLEEMRRDGKELDDAWEEWGLVPEEEKSVYGELLGRRTHESPTCTTELREVEEFLYDCFVLRHRKRAPLQLLIDECIAHGRGKEEAMEEWRRMGEAERGVYERRADAEALVFGRQKRLLRGKKYGPSVRRFLRYVERSPSWENSGYLRFIRSNFGRARRGESPLKLAVMFSEMWKKSGEYGD